MERQPACPYLQSCCLEKITFTYFLHFTCFYIYLQNYRSHILVLITRLRLLTLCYAKERFSSLILSSIGILFSSFRSQSILLRHVRLKAESNFYFMLIKLLGIASSYHIRWVALYYSYLLA